MRGPAYTGARRDKISAGFLIVTLLLCLLHARRRAPPLHSVRQRFVNVYSRSFTGQISRLNLACAGPQGDSRGHVLPQTTSRGLRGLVSHHALVNAGCRESLAERRRAEVYLSGGVGREAAARAGGGGTSTANGMGVNESSIDMYNNDVGKRFMK